MTDHGPIWFVKTCIYFVNTFILFGFWWQIFQKYFKNKDTRDKFKKSCLVLFILWWKAVLMLKRHLVPLSDLDTGNCALPPGFAFSSLSFSPDFCYLWYEMLCAERYWQLLIKIHFTLPVITSKEQRSFLSPKNWKPKFSLRYWAWKLCLCLISNIWWFLSFQLNNWPLSRIHKNWILGLLPPGAAES